MRILVISDTHIPVAQKTLPRIILEEAKKASLCLHAGDLIVYDVFEKLNSLTHHLSALLAMLPDIISAICSNSFIEYNI